MVRFTHMRRNITLVLGSVLLLTGGALALWAATLRIPDVTALEARKVVQSAKIYDRTGTVLLDDIVDDVTRTIVPLSEISPLIQQAAIAIEDSEFYQHPGIKPTAIVRALIANILIEVGLSDGYTQGGSTITQQVIKNSILTTDKTLTRKLKEWVLALKLEQTMSKDQILELYLNESPYGGAIYGVEEAALTFFGKHAKDVGLAEAAYLAALPQAPTYYSPYGNHRDALDARKNTVLARMREVGFISEAEYQRAKAETVAFLPPAPSGIRAPHFVFYVRELLEKEFGSGALEEGGWRVITSIDADLQAKAEEIVGAYAAKNEKDFNASNAALVAIAPRDGDILAMVGSRDYFHPSIGAYNVIVSAPGRQPGSAFKPFVYAAAFEKGYAPETVLFDTPTQFSTSCPIESTSNEPPCYSPGNYDDTFRGPMSLRDALAQSVNVVAVKALYLVGLQDAVRLARAAGITTLTDPARYGLTLVLGGGEVKPLELTSAYGVFANDGVRNAPRAILRIEDRNGNAIREYGAVPERVIDSDVARAITDVLSDNAARMPAFGAASALLVPGHHVAAKTGTTNDYRDAWIVGYSTSLAVGAWAGNNDNTPMQKRVAGFIVAPMWNEFMRYALTAYPDQPFPEAPPLTDASSKPILRGIWQGDNPVSVGTQTKVTVNVHDILYWVDPQDPTGVPPVHPDRDPQFARWEYGARRWAAQNGYVDGQPLLLPYAY